MSSQSDLIHLRVKSATHSEEVHFKIKKATPLKKLMEKFAERIGVENINTVTFLYEGERVYPNNTPEQLNMQEKDLIEVTVNQVGGSRTL